MYNKDGIPAFPVVHEVAPPDGSSQRAIFFDHGMTLRDYFAAKALQGLTAGLNAGDDADAVPALCYAFADAMLTERAK